MEIDSSISAGDDAKAIREAKDGWPFVVIRLSQTRHPLLLAHRTFQVLVPLVCHSGIIGNIDDGSTQDPVAEKSSRLLIGSGLADYAKVDVCEGPDRSAN
jgi:hypothetical protein